VSASPLDLGDAAADEMRALRIRLEADAMSDSLQAVIVDCADRGDGLIPVRRAEASCTACDWHATMTGDTDDEITDFLRLLWWEHATTMHPRRRTHE
jgi:hypothetical protein